MWFFHAGASQGLVKPTTCAGMPWWCTTSKKKGGQTPSNMSSLWAMSMLDVSTVVKTYVKTLGVPAWSAWCPLWRMRIHPWSFRCRTLRCTIAGCEEAVIQCTVEVRLDRTWSKIFTTTKWCIPNARKHQRLRRYLMTLVFPRCLKARMLDRSTCFICLCCSHSCCHCCCKTWHCWLLARMFQEWESFVWILGGVTLPKGNKTSLIYLWPMAHSFARYSPPNMPWMAFKERHLASASPAWASYSQSFFWGLPWVKDDPSQCTAQCLWTSYIGIQSYVHLSIFILDIQT